MTQYVINIGTLPNDGTGDPLRTAFNETNLNFDQVFAAGPVLSNVRIANNTILTTNVNGNLVLAPNGIGVVQSNVNIVPNTSNIRNLGSATRRWSELYVQYANVSGNIDLGGNFVITGDLTVGGNLSVTGNIINVANIITDAKTIQLANTAGTANSANGSGITVGANDAIATFLFNSANNVWNTNIGISATGNIYGNVVAPGGNGQVLYNRSGVIGASPLDFNFDESSYTLYVKVGSFSGNIDGTDALYVGAPGFTFLGSDIMAQFTGNVPSYSQINFQNISNSAQASGDYIITADNGTDTTHFIDLGITSSTWDGTEVNGLGTEVGPDTGYLYVQDGNLAIGTRTGNSVHVWTFTDTGNVIASGNLIPKTSNTYSLGNSSLWWSNVWVAGNTIYIGGVPIGMSAGNVLTVNGNAVLQNDSNTTISTTGNITADYFFGNGSQLTGLSTSSISNGISNVEISNINGPVTINVNGTETWEFDDGGNLTLPTNGSIVVDGGDGVIGPISDDLVISWDNEEIRVVSVGGSIEMQADAAFRVQTNYDGANVLYASRWEFSNNEIVNISNNFGIVSEAGNLTLSGGRDGVNSGNSIIRSVDVGVAVYDWTFDNAGVLTLPNGGEIDNDGNNIEVRSTNNINFEATSDLNIYTDDGNSQWTFGSGNTLTLPGGTATIDSSDDNIELRSNNNINIETFNDVNIYTGDGAYQFYFSYNGGFVLPANGAIVGETANNNGYINWVGNSSGDGNGFSTLTLVPDDTVSVQSLVLDPTAPGHIHLRAPGLAGNIEQPNANIFLGPENTNFEITSQYGNATAEARIHSAGNTWTFANDGNLVLPSDANIVGTTPNNTGHLQWLGNSAGDGSGSTTLRLIPDDTLEGNEQYIIIDPTGGGDIHIRPGGNIDNSNGRLILGGENSAFVVESGPNPTLKIFSDENEWAFYGNAELAAPGDISAVGNITGSYIIGNGSQLTGLPAGYANSDVANFLAAFGSNSISTTGNVTANNISGNIQITGNVTGTTPNVTLIAGSYSYVFDNTGVLTLPTIGGNEGGELNFGIPAANTTLTAPVKLDVYQDRIRFFDGSTKGLYIDVANCPTGVSTAIGYRDIPQVSFTGNATIAATDAGKHYYSTESSNYTLTIANNTSVGWSVGTAITIVNRGTGNMTIAQGTGVSLYLAGNSTAGNRTVTTYGMATLLNVAANVWMINGTGVS